MKISTEKWGCGFSVSAVTDRRDKREETGSGAPGKYFIPVKVQFHAHPTIMMNNAYIFDISRATDAPTLRGFRRDILADETLDAAERDELCAAIDRRFAFLNAEQQNFNSRWS